MKNEEGGESFQWKSALDGGGNVQSQLLGGNHTLLKAYDLVEEYLLSAFYRL